MTASSPVPTPPTAMGDATGLAADLAARGVACRIEARDRLALLVPTGELPDLASPALRREWQALATARGFTHLALALDEEGTDAPRHPGAGSRTTR